MSVWLCVLRFFLRILRRFCLNYLTFGLMFFPCVFCMLWNPGNYWVFRDLQRAIEPDDTVMIWLRENDNGQRQLDCSLLPGADRQILAKKLQAADTLLLLNTEDPVEVKEVQPCPPRTSQEDFNLNLSSCILLSILFAANPAGRLARCWKTRHHRRSRIKLTVIFTIMTLPLLCNLWPGASRLYWQNRVASLVSQPHQTFYSVRDGHKGLVVLVYTAAPGLQAELEKALNLTSQDRLSVVQVAPPIEVNPPSHTSNNLLLMIAYLSFNYYLWCYFKSRKSAQPDIKTGIPPEVKARIKQWFAYLDRMSRWEEKPPDSKAADGLILLP